MGERERQAYLRGVREGQRCFGQWADEALFMSGNPIPVGIGQVAGLACFLLWAKAGRSG